MKNKLNFSERIFRPQNLGGVFGGLLKKFGIRTSSADLANRWDEIVGPDLARIGKLSGVRKTKNKKINVSIKPIVPQWRQKFLIALKSFV